MDVIFGKDPKEKYYDEKLPEGDKYLGLVNVGIISMLNF